MLKEAANIRQNPGEPRRRWFDDEYFDLIVWFEPGEEIWGFQLCYDRERKPRALTWTRQYGYRHSGIDTGESVTGTSQVAPVLVEDGLFDSGSVGRKLAVAARDLPKDIAAFVLQKIKEFKL